MTTRGLELASETLTNELGRLWEVEKSLANAKSNYEYTQRDHDSVLEATHKALIDYKAAEKEWWEERKGESSKED
jgi:hypothetical protein